MLQFKTTRPLRLMRKRDALWAVRKGKAPRGEWTGFGTSEVDGGVAAKTREAMLLCEAAGFDVVLVETVGIGQSETAVCDMTDFFLALMLPGGGDRARGGQGLLRLALPAPRRRARPRRRRLLSF